MEIGINKVHFNISSTNNKLNIVNKEWVWDYFLKNENTIRKLIDINKTYISAEITQLYMAFDDYDFADYFEKIKNIWKNKDIVIACGERVFNNIQNNIFDCAKSIEYVNCPSTNAFSKYEEILNRLKQIEKSKLIILILGPTATVLAFDLHNLGYRALDFGHIAKDYDAYCKKLTKTHENVAKFFDAD